MKLAHTMIRVKDLDATLDFYTGFLGLKETRRRPIGDEAMLVFLEDGQASYQIELTVNHGKDDYELGDQFGHLAFFTDDLERVVTDVESRGWWYRRSKPGMTANYIFVKDPNGYDIEILEKRES
jgi:lactoylglutathione lyase